MFLEFIFLRALVLPDSTNLIEAIGVFFMEHIGQIHCQFVFAIVKIHWLNAPIMFLNLLDLWSVPLVFIVKDSDNDE